MNRLLAETLSALNAMLALSIIAGGAIVAYVYPGPWWPGSPALLAVAGGVAGLVVAGVVCGLIAFLSLIERHLREIAERPIVHSGKAMRSDDRREPTV